MKSGQKSRQRAAGSGQGNPEPGYGSVGELLEMTPEGRAAAYQESIIDRLIEIRDAVRELVAVAERMTAQKKFVEMWIPPSTGKRLGDLAARQLQRLEKAAQKSRR